MSGVVTLSHSGHQPASAMSCEMALLLLASRRRDDQIVVSNQMTARVWPSISKHPLDFNYLSSTMGGAVPLGLGMALARPEHEVVVLSGDGSLLMNLGCLATVVASGARNISIVLLDNGLYEVTGGQLTPGRAAEVDYASIAKAVGFSHCRAFDNIESWHACIHSQWPTTGPNFFSLRVNRIEPSTERCTTTKVDVELRRLREHLLHRSTIV